MNAIGHTFYEAIESFRDFVHHKIEELARKIIQSSFYMGFRVLPSKVILE